MTRAGLAEVPQTKDGEHGEDGEDGVERAPRSTRRSLPVITRSPRASPSSPPSPPCSSEHRGNAGAGPLRPGHRHPPCGPGWSLPAPVWRQGLGRCSYARPRAPAAGRCAGSTVAAISRAAIALSPSVPSRESGSPTTTANGIVQGDELEKARHRQALTFPALQGLERGGEHLGFVAEGEADPELTPVPGRCRNRPKREVRSQKWVWRPSKFTLPRPTAPWSRRTPCCSSSASCARAETRGLRPAACRRGSCAAGRPG